MEPMEPVEPHFCKVPSLNSFKISTYFKKMEPWRRYTHLYWQNYTPPSPPPRLMFEFYSMVPSFPQTEPSLHFK